jgi:monofunctional biosynthetic peptidoglycan transglycosylase
MAWLKEVAKPARIAGKLLRSLVGLVLLGHLLLIALVLVASLALLAVNPRVTALMMYRGLTVHQKAQPIRFVPLRQIPRVARSMVIKLEDYRFYQHHGVDLGAIREAWAINASLGRTVVGGSTIPMQLARNFFLTPRKTYFRKYLEAIIALEMDLLMPKDRILELYLNSIEWGRGIFGIGAASAHYYKSGVGGLSLDQLRRLVTIITNPIRFNVQTFMGSRQMSERYAYLVTRFPDPSAEPLGPGPGAPVPDAADAGASSPAGDNGQTAPGSTIVPPAATPSVPPGLPDAPPDGGSPQ